MTSNRQLEDLSIVFKALGNPHRLAIVRVLLAHEQACCTGDSISVCDLDNTSCNVGDLGKSLAIDNSTVSHHLKELDYAGLITRVRRGRQIYCSINRERLDEIWLYLMPKNAGDLLIIKEATRSRAS